jgi:hypothetical protein
VTASTHASRTAVSLVLFTAINLLVIVKYAPRFHLSAAAGAAAYVAAVAAGVWLSTRMRGAFGKRRRLLPALLVGLAVLLLFAVLERVSPSGLRVDRWSAITAFNDRLLLGQFPYEARTHLGSRVSGLPLLFVVGLPFQLAGDVGYLQLFVLMAVVAAATWKWGRQFDLLWPALLLVTSPAFLWEVAARSDLMSNALLVVLFLAFCERWRGRLSGRRVAVVAVLAGLCAGTRLAMVVPMLVYFTGWFRGQAWWTGVGAVVAAVLVFGAALLPFAFWDWPAFLANNPLAWQSSLVPAPVQLAALAVAVGAGRGASDLGQAAYRGGGITFVAVAGSFALAVSTLGFDGALRGSGFDISYFDIAVPFLLVPLLFAHPAPVLAPGHVESDR